MEEENKKRRYGCGKKRNRTSKRSQILGISIRFRKITKVEITLKIRQKRPIIGESVV